jgi:hypothetical protein
MLSPADAKVTSFLDAANLSPEERLRRGALWKEHDEVVAPTREAEAQISAHTAELQMLREHVEGLVYTLEKAEEAELSQHPALVGILSLPKELLTSEHAAVVGRALSVAEEFAYSGFFLGPKPAAAMARRRPE